MTTNIKMAPEVHCFFSHLDEIVREEKLYSVLDDSKELIDTNDLLLEIVSHYVNVRDFVEYTTLDFIKEAINSFGVAPERRIVVAPCSPLFSNVLEQISSVYRQSVFVDKGRSGAVIGGKIIECSEKFIQDDNDICLILTRNVNAIKSYEDRFGKDNCINALSLYENEKLNFKVKGIDDFLKIIDLEKKPVLFSSVKPMGTTASTVRELGRNGYSVYWLGSEEVKDGDNVGYATPKVKDMGYQGYFIGGLIDNIYAFSNLMRGTALFHFEAIYPPNWDFSRIAICYAATLAMIRTVKDCRVQGSTSKFALYMYDAIKPGVKNYQSGEACGRLYKKMISEAEAVVYSSYTEAFGDFVENSIGKPLNRVHSHRYQVVPKGNRRPRLKGAYHIAIISILLEEFWEPSRMGIAQYIRDIIHQGIHIHYYASDTGHPKLDEFRASLPPERQCQFHLHEPIHDLDELASELSQYHAGWSLFNMQIFNDMTTHLTDQFTSDAMELFTPTTLPSVIWTCAAAGLPVICNRSMRGVVDMLPAGMTLPLSLSELHHLKEIFDQQDWDSIDSTCLDQLDIENQIHKLDTFLCELHA